MAMIDVDWKPDDARLRSFANISGVFAIVAFILYAVGWLPTILVKVLVPYFLFVCATRLFSLRVTRVFYIGMMVIALPIGMCVSFLLMLLFYGLIITPVGLCFRLLGHDALRLKFTRTASSYWVARKPPKNMHRYFQQF